jgi:phage shock protein PspC (stress-responsive transcriptional regulator)
MNEHQNTPDERRPRKLLRSRRNRVFGGVAGGTAEYFGIDPVIVRVLFVALVFLGGASLLLYLAALLLVPDEDGHVAADASTFRGKALIGVAAVLLCIAIGSLLPDWGDGWFFWPLVPIGFLALVGLGLWWLIRGDRPRGEPVNVLRAIALVFVLLVACTLLAVGSAWASAVGGAEVVAALVIGAGALLAVGAFVGRVRWLILPALAVALPLAVVSAADIEVDGSVGERTYRPGSAAELRDHYELGVGDLVVDLREAELPPGRHPLKLEVGVGEAYLVVPEDTCVISDAKVGMGQVTVFDRGSGGVDVEWEDGPVAPADAPTVVLDADVGLGVVQVHNSLVSHHRHGRDWDDEPAVDETGFDACEASRA